MLFDLQAVVFDVPGDVLDLDAVLVGEDESPWHLLQFDRRGREDGGDVVDEAVARFNPASRMTCSDSCIQVTCRFS